jgi:hypothetical protein
VPQTPPLPSVQQPIAYTPDHKAEGHIQVGESLSEDLLSQPLLFVQLEPHNTAILSSVADMHIVPQPVINPQMSKQMTVLSVDPTCATSPKQENA